MTSLKRPAEDTEETTVSAVPNAAPAPSHLYVLLTDEEHGGALDSAHEGPRPLGVARTLSGATELLKTMHDASEANKDAREEFEGLDASNKKGKVVGEATVGDMQVRVEKWKVTTAKTVSTSDECVEQDAIAASPTTSIHYAYTILYSWSDYYGDEGGHTFGGVALQPSSVPGLTRAKLPSKGLASIKFPAVTARDGIIIADERDSKGKGKKHAGQARRWIVRDWEADQASKKAPARKKAKTLE